MSRYDIENKWLFVAHSEKKIVIVFMLVQRELDDFHVIV